MSFSTNDISDNKARSILSVMRRSRGETPTSDETYFALENSITPLTFAEVCGLILRLLNEEIGVVLGGLDDIRWVYVSSRKKIPSDVEVHRNFLTRYVRFLYYYNKPGIPREPWAAAAADYVRLYRQQVSRGIIPTGDTPEWGEFYARHIPALDELLTKQGFNVEPVEYD